MITNSSSSSSSSSNNNKAAIAAALNHNDGSGGGGGGGGLTTSSSSSPGTALIHTIRELFNTKVASVLEQKRALLPRFDGIYLFQIHSSLWLAPIYWTINLKVGVAYEGKPTTATSTTTTTTTASSPDCTYQIEAVDLIAMLNGKLNTAQAFLSGRLKIQGNTAAAFKFQQFMAQTETEQNEAIQQKQQQQQQQQKRNSLKSDSTTTTTLAKTASNLPKMNINSSSFSRRQMSPLRSQSFDSIPADGLKCDIIFEIIRSRFATEPELVRKMPFVVQIDILKNKIPMTSWTIDTRTSGGRVVRSVPSSSSVSTATPTATKSLKPDAILTIEDEDYIQLLFGKLNPQRAFMKGMIKVKGNIMLLQRLDTLWNQMQKSRRDPEYPFVKQLLLGEKFQHGLRSELVFFDLIQRLVRLPTTTLFPPNTSIRFCITQNGQQKSEWLISTNDTGKLSWIKHRIHATDTNTPTPTPIAGKADCELTLEDDEFVRLIRVPGYKLSEAITAKRVAISGDSTLIDKLEQLFSFTTTNQSSTSNDEDNSTAASNKSTQAYVPAIKSKL